MKRTTLTLAALLAVLTVGISNTAHAQESHALDWVPADVMLVGSLNLEPLKTHPALAQLREWVQKGDIGKGLDQFAEFTGLDARRNIDRIYAFGYANDAGGAAILEGSFETAQLQTFLESQYGMKKEAIGAITMFQWWDEKEQKEQAAVLDGPHRIVFGDPLAVRNAAKTRTGVIPTAKAVSEEFRLWKAGPNPASRLLRVLAMPDPNSIEDETLKSLKNASLTLDMADDVALEVISGWTSAEHATAVANFVEAAWNAHKELKVKPTQPDLAALMERLRVATSGSTATLQMAVPAQLFATKLQEMIEN